MCVRKDWVLIMKALPSKKASRDDLYTIIKNKENEERERYEKLCNSIYKSKDLKGMVYTDTGSRFMDLIYYNFKNYINGDDNFFADNLLCDAKVDNLIYYPKDDYRDRARFIDTDKMLMEDIPKTVIINKDGIRVHFSIFNGSSNKLDGSDLRINLNTRIIDVMTCFFNYNNDGKQYGMINGEKTIFSRIKQVDE